MRNIRQLLHELSQDSISKSSFFLVLNTIVTTGLGFLFWTLNARIFSSEQVGLASAVISAMNLIIALTGLGFGTAIIRFLPTAETRDEKNRYVNTFLSFNALIVFAASSLFLLFLSIVSPRLLFIKESIYLAAAFIFFVTAFSAFSLLDSVMMAYDCARWIVVKNSVFSAIKILLPIMLVSAGAYGIFASWGIAAIIALIASLVFLYKRFGYRARPAIHESLLRRTFSFSFGNYLSDLLSRFPGLVMPIMITNMISPESAAYFYVAWMIAGLVLMIPDAISSALFAEGSRNSEAVEQRVKHCVKLILLALTPAVIIGMIASKYLLMLFGAEYSKNASLLLSLLILYSIPFSVRSLYLSIKKIRKEVGQIIAVNAIGSILTLVLCYLTMERGLVFIGLSYLTAQIAIAAYILAFGLRIPRREGCA